jgi:flavin-dependent dehydrogenase
VNVDHDVVISGAGPAGVAAAVALALRQPSLARRILVLDKARFPREKPCGGGLTGHARAALDALDLRIRVPHVPCSEGRIVYRGSSRDVRLGRPVDIVRRREFDADLVAQARDRGLDVVEGEGLAAFTVDERSAVVRVETTAGRRITARVLVGADGAGSRVRRALAGDRRPPLRLFQAEVPMPPAISGNFRVGEGGLRPPEPVAGGAGPSEGPGRMTYDFSPMDAGLRGYVWLFPVAADRVNVGAMHYPSRALSGAGIERLLRASLARHGVALPEGARGWPAWRYDARAPIAGPHVLCVGDAAGIDALTGEGIAVGLEHGPLAAAAVSEALGSGDFRFARYGRAVARAVVGRELSLDRRLARLLYAPRAFRLWLSLILFDRRMQELYAARVSGSEVLADRRGALLAALGRHAVAAPSRLRRLAALPALSSC